ncbi:MAG: peptidase M15 [Salinivirgaceae bacterium]|nr:peptidase M15 [Salinivirgaceae bacterium]
MITTKNYFTIKEMIASDTAKKLGIDNTPSEDVKANLQSLITNVLNPAREIYGKPITVSSGYRCPALNAALKGAKTSQHQTGQAADLVPANSKGSLAEIFAACAAVGNYDQLIVEQNAAGNKWVHVSYDPTKNRRQLMSYVSNRNPQYINITVDQAKQFLA